MSLSTKLVTTLRDSSVGQHIAADSLYDSRLTDESLAAFVEAVAGSRSMAMLLDGDVRGISTSWLTGWIGVGFREDVLALLKMLPRQSMVTTDFAETTFAKLASMADAGLSPEYLAAFAMADRWITSRTLDAAAAGWAAGAPAEYALATL